MSRFGTRIASGTLMLLLTVVVILVVGVQPAESEVKTIVVPDEYPTIQEAINAASEGDTIFVKRGIYRETLVINKSITLAGASLQDTVIDGYGIVGSGWIRAVLFNVTSNDVIIEGFTIQRGSIGVYCSTINVTIQDNIIIDNDINGILLEFSSYSWETVVRQLPSNNTISGNNVTGHDYGDITLIGSSYNTITGNNVGYVFLGCAFNLTKIQQQEGEIQLFNSSYNTFSGNNLTEGFWLYGEPLPPEVDPDLAEGLYGVAYNTFAGNVAGFYLDKVAYNTISGNNITGADGPGVQMLNSSYNTLTGNSIIANEVGVTLNDSSYNTISGNTVASNGEGIKLDGSSHNTLTGNDITNNTGTAFLWPAGLWLNNSSYNTISVNNMADNRDYVITLRNSHNNMIFHNNFVNTVWGVYVSTDSVNIWNDDYPSGGNYWSDYGGADEKSGPDQDQPGSDGIGDTSYIIDSNNRDWYPLTNPIVIPEYSSFLILPLFMISTLLAVIVYKRKHTSKVNRIVTC